jgi:dihydropteroate synthase
VRRRFTVPLARGANLFIGERTLIMGVINVTPDSFSDGGRLLEPARAIEAGVRMAEEGADLLDIGGESTRPGAEPIGESEERRRVMPVVEGLASRVEVPLSVDTYRASTAAAALAAGAGLINDISGSRYDPDLAGVVAAGRAAIVLMHTRGRSRGMYEQATYHDVIGEVLDELRQSIAFAASAGITSDRIIVDPGLGFAKEARHNYEVLAHLDAFAELGHPLLVGPSRKSFLVRPESAARAGHARSDSQPVNRREPAELRGVKGEPASPARPADAWTMQPAAPAERDWATAAAVTAAVLAGAHIVRVHAVREMKQVVRVADEIRRYHA